ncbi:MAG: VCBS repeat-containing protein [Chitinophagales bacterium]|nr:VCBS repeat-containing protein [Chitinophagales bacterium]
MKKLYMPLLFVAAFGATKSASAQCCSYNDSGQNLGAQPTFGVALGDFDQDGDADAFTVDAYEDLEIYFNDGNGNFSLNQTITPGSNQKDNFGVEVADVDNDGDLDAVVAPFYSSCKLKIYKNDSTGNFSQAQAINSSISAAVGASAVVGPLTNN